MKRKEVWGALILLGALGLWMWLPPSPKDPFTSFLGGADGEIGTPTEASEADSDSSASMLSSQVAEGSRDNSQALTRATEPVQQPGLISLVSTSGDPVVGRVVLLHDSQQLRAGIAQATLLGESLWHDLLDIDELATAGEITIDRGLLHPTAETLVMVFAAGFAPHLQSLGTQPQFPLRIELPWVAPITVKVQSPSGVPIPNAVVAVRSGRAGVSNAEASLTEQLRWMFFQEAVYSDAEGTAELKTVLQEGNNILVQPGSGFAASSADEVPPGANLTMTCEEAFQVHGRVLNPTGQPIAHARVKAYSNLSADYVFVDGSIADEEGRFALTKLPASQPAIQIFASMEGYETAPWTVANPAPGIHYQNDFELHPAVGGDIRLVTSAGSPLSGVYLTFYRSNADHVPGYYLTDADGNAKLKPVLREGYPYIVKMESGNQDIQLDESYFAGSGRTMVVPGLSRVVSWSLDPALSQGRSLAYAVWTPSDSSKPGQFWWDAKEEAPWIPSGQGVFAAQFTDGSCIEQSTHLEEGEDAHIEFNAPSTLLSMTLLGSSEGDVLLHSQSGNILFQAEGLTGEVDIPCDPGIYELNVRLADQSPMTFTGIRVPRGGADLGEIGSVANASLRILMVNAEGNPVPHSFVSLVSPSGFEAAASLTGMDGFAFFPGMTPGPYFAYCNNEEAYALEGRESLTSVHLFPGQHQELTLRMGSAEGLIRVSVDRKGLPMPQGIFIGDSSRLNYHLPSHGTATLPASAENGFLGVTANRTGYALIAAVSIPPGPGHYRIDRDGLRAWEFQFTDEAGSPQPGLTLGFYLAGHHLPYRPITDADGRLSLEFQAGLPLEMEVWSSGGTPLRFSLEDLTSGQNIVIPSEFPRKVLSFRDLDGTAIPGLQLVGLGLNECLHGKHDGTVEVPIVSGRSYIAQAAGFFPVILDPSAAASFTLPRSLESVTLHGAPKGTRYLSMVASPGYDSPFPLSSLVERAEDGPWIAESLPEGEVLVIAFDEEDKILGKFRVFLTAQESNYLLTDQVLMD